MVRDVANIPQYSKIHVLTKQHHAQTVDRWIADVASSEHVTAVGSTQFVYALILTTVGNFLSF